MLNINKKNKCAFHFQLIRKRSSKLNIKGKLGMVVSLFVFNLCHAEYFLCVTHLPNFYLVYLQHSSCKQVFSIRVKNNLNPDQVALSEAN